MVWLLRTLLCWPHICVLVARDLDCVVGALGTHVREGHGVCAQGTVSPQGWHGGLGCRACHS